jgi:hypothetical protein
MGNRVVGATDWLPGDFQHIVTMGLDAQLRLAPAVFVDLDIAWALFAPDREDDLFATATFTFGNPTAGVHWSDLMNDKVAAASGTITVSAVFRIATHSAEDREQRPQRPRHAWAGRGSGHAEYHRFLRTTFLRGRAEWS